MKLFNQFTILPRYLKAFNYAGNKMEETTRNLDRDNHLFEEYCKSQEEKTIKLTYRGSSYFR